jgi:hypothetical protein
LQNSFAASAPIYAMLVPENVKGTMLTTAKDVLRHAAAVLKNVEGWLDNRAAPIF